MTLVLFQICFSHNRHCLLCRLIEAVFTSHAIDLPRLAFDLADHLRTAALDHVLIHELLTASSIGVCSGATSAVKIWRLLVIAHRGQTLVGDST